jgi:ABC-2 type transport system permease protein
VTGGFYTLFYKEVLRFWKVFFQTIAAPVVTTLLYLLIFSHALSTHVEALPGVNYAAFLVPGLVMMAMLQNAFANSSSSIIQSKVTGNIIFILLPPLTHWDMWAAYLGAAMLRASLVGVSVFVAASFFTAMPVHSALWIAAFALLGGGMLAQMGMIAGLWADKFDQLASFQNFVILPLTFLSGVFYSIHSLPVFWQQASHLNPFFFTIDGFRYGFFGTADVSPWLSLAVVGGAFLALSWLTLSLFKAGYKLRH